MIFCVGPFLYISLFVFQKITFFFFFYVFLFVQLCHFKYVFWLVFTWLFLCLSPNFIPHDLNCIIIYKIILICLSMCFFSCFFPCIFSYISPNVFLSLCSSVYISPFNSLFKISLYIYSSVCYSSYVLLIVFLCISLRVFFQVKLLTFM